MRIWNLLFKEFAIHGKYSTGNNVIMENAWKLFHFAYHLLYKKHMKLICERRTYCNIIFDIIHCNACMWSNCHDFEILKQGAKCEWKPNNLFSTYCIIFTIRSIKVFHLFSQCSSEENLDSYGRKDFTHERRSFYWARWTE